MKRFLMLALCFLMLLPLGCVRPEGNVTPSGTPRPMGNTATPTVPTAAVTEEPSGKSYCFDRHFNATGISGWGTYVLETEDTVFYLCNNIMYFSDKEYKDFMPLCGRPDCKHNGRDCDAYIDAAGGFWIYGDHIWYASYNLEGRDPDSVRLKQPSLWRMRLDGSQHKEVMDIEIPDLGFTPARTRWGFTAFDKYFCFSYTAYKYETDRDYYYSEGYITLDDLNYVENVREHRDGDYQNSEADLSGSAIFSDGSLVYELNCVRTGPEISDRYYRLVTWDIEKNEYTHIGTFEDQPAILEGLIMPKDGGFIYMPYLTAENKKSIRFLDLETGEDIATAEGDLDTLRVSQFDWKNGWLCGVYRDPGLDPKNSGFYVYDAEGHILEIATCEGLPEETMYLDVFLQTDSYFFAAPLPHDEDGNVKALDSASTIPTWYIDKSEIGTGNLAWHRWAPEG